MRLSDLTSYPPTWRGRYPGLDEPSREIMTRWLTRHASETNQMWYNVRLYPLATEAEGLTGPEYEIWRDLAALRVDAVAATPVGLWLVEVLPIPNTASIGRLVAYNARWPAQFPADKIAGSLVVYAEANHLIVNIVKSLGYRAEQV